MLGNMRTIVIFEKCRDSRHFLTHLSQQSEQPSFACPYAQVYSKQVHLVTNPPTSL